MKTVIHVNQQLLRQNVKDGGCRPVLIARTYKGVTYGHQIEIQGPSRIVQGKLSCGARAWIETEAEVVVK